MHSLQNSSVFIFLVLLPLCILSLAWVAAYFFGSLLPKLKANKVRPLPPKARPFPESTKAKLVSFVHEDTKASFGLCKRALEEVDYDLDKAIRLLHATSAIQNGYELRHGRIHTYQYQDKIGVVVEVTCETEAAASTVDFGMFVQELALQVAATNPAVIQRNLIGPSLDPLSSIPPPPPEELGSVLLEQVSVIPDHKGKTVQQLLNDLSFYLKESITIRRFTRYEIGA